MMKYNCIPCDYSTMSRANYERHNASKTHIMKNNAAEEEKFKKKQEQEATCEDCGKKFAFKTSLYKHKKNCDKSILIAKEKAEEVEKLTCNNCGMIFAFSSGLSRHKNICQVEEKKTPIVFNDKLKYIKFNMIETDDHVQKYICNYCGKLFKYHSGLSTHKNQNRCKAIKSKSEQNNTNITNITNNNTNNDNRILNNNANISNIFYITINFPDAPAIEPIPKNLLPTYDFDTLVYENSRGTLPIYLGEFLVNHYKKDDPGQRSFWNTDKSRDNYTVREVVPDTNKLFWNDDPSGFKVRKHAIDPFLECLDKELSQQLLNNNIKKNMTYSQREECNERMSAIANIRQQINNKSLANNIIKYLSTKFNISEIRLLENSKPELVDKSVKTEIKTKLKENKAKKIQNNSVSMNNTKESSQNVSQSSEVIADEMNDSESDNDDQINDESYSDDSEVAFFVPHQLKQEISKFKNSKIEIDSEDELA